MDIKETLTIALDALKTSVPMTGTAHMMAIAKVSACLEEIAAKPLTITCYICKQERPASKRFCNCAILTPEAPDADIATLEQENRQMRARMERLERERNDLERVLVRIRDIVEASE